ncbi:MAG: three-Cys-motif partner protein TcmP [Candidatus Hydrogenedentes bacterium]|nr:three-Cys-motif partner protein TcmP [Candidatus Hydrogenedentota bacterium]
MEIPDFYDDREQTLVKHVVLRTYLERFAHIIGNWCKSITYIDCFSGPWESRDVALSDTSFGIAIKELTKARDDLRESPLKKKMRVRCCFVEKDQTAASRLRSFAESVPDVEIRIVNNTFQASIPEILEFVKADPDTFAFYFIDPKGWTGFDMSTIKPLFANTRSEVLVNFMSYHINRFIRVPDYADSFIGLYGCHDFLSRIDEQSSGRDSIEAMVQVYCDNLRKSGAFEFVSSAYVIHRDMDCKHYHLIYGTRNIRGLEEFRKAERNAMEVMEHARNQVRQRRALESGQGELFGSEEIQERWPYYEELRETQLKATRSALFAKLKEDKRVSFDEFWKFSLHFPLVWHSDVSNWIKEWRKSDGLQIVGLASGERTPKFGKNHSLVLLK